MTTEQLRKSIVIDEYYRPEGLLLVASLGVVSKCLLTDRVRKRSAASELSAVKERLRDRLIRKIYTDQPPTTNVIS